MPSSRRTPWSFTELKNVGDKPITLAGFRFTKGLNFVFNNSAIDHLDPGQLLVVASDLDGFNARYGTAGIPLAGRYTGNLSDSGSRITLSGRSEERRVGEEG